MRAIQALFIAQGALVAVFYPFLSINLRSRGFEPAAIGLILAVSAAGATIAIPTWGHLADVVLGRRRTVTVAVLLAAGFALAFEAQLPLPALAVLIVAYTFAQSPLAPLADALAVNALGERRAEYPRVRLLTSLSFGIAVTLVGPIYDRTGFGPAAVLYAILAVALIWAVRGVTDLPRANLRQVDRDAVSGNRPGNRPGTPTPPAQLTGLLRLGSFGHVLAEQPRVRPVLLAIGLVSFGLMGGFTFFGIRLVELGGQPSDLALASALGAFAEVPAMAVTPRLVRRIGLRGIFSGGAILLAGVLLVWGLASSPTVLVLSRLLTGVGYTGAWVGATLTMSALVPARLQGTAQGLFQAASFGLAAVLANIVGGLLYGSAGALAFFGLGAIASLVAAVVSWRGLPDRVASGPR